MATTRCPGCGGALQPDRTNGAFRCASCQGRFVKRFALDAVGVRIPRDSARTLPRRPRRCAACPSEMDTIKVGNVTLDICEDCSAIYFDAGELDAMSARKPAPKESELDCDGCGKVLPISELESVDGKALCADCKAGITVHTRMNEADYATARRHTGTTAGGIATQVAVDLTTDVASGGVADFIGSLLDLF